MSYDISLHEPVGGAVVEFDEPHQMFGGTYAAGGTREAWINLTYNYSPIFHRVFPERKVSDKDPSFLKDPRMEGTVNGVRVIYGLTGAESIPVLQSAIAQLGDDVDPDYWKATEGNVKAALCKLLAMARMRPDAVWSGD